MTESATGQHVEVCVANDGNQKATLREIKALFTQADSGGSPCSVTLTAQGDAISRAISIAERVRRTLKGQVTLTQFNAIGTVTKEGDMFTPADENLDRAVMSSSPRWPCIKITLQLEGVSVGIPGDGSVPSIDNRT